jgi:hypothetical protein
VFEDCLLRDAARADVPAAGVRRLLALAQDWQVPAR